MSAENNMTMGEIVKAMTINMAIIEKENKLIRGEVIKK
jgi:hypothetical protein